jgi:DNA-binding NarL/FixJ family response regulator
LKARLERRLGILDAVLAAIAMESTLEPLTIALVEDDPGMRQRLVSAIESSDGLDLRYQGGSSVQVVEWLGQHAVDVLLVDLGLPDGSGIDVIRAARRLQPRCDVMVVTMFADEVNMLQTFAAGARGYLIKDGTEQDVAHHVRTLRAGGSPMSPMIARRLLQLWNQSAAEHVGSTASGLIASPPSNAFGAAPPRAAGLAMDPLTVRECDVLALVARGFPYDEVAQQLGLQISTVRTHVRSIYGKLDVHNKAEAVFEARSLGLLH